VQIAKNLPNLLYLSFSLLEMQVRFIFIKTLKFSIYKYTAESENVQKYEIKRKGRGEENLKDGKLAQTRCQNLSISTTPTGHL
jgi:hypothetical protein